jgi:hypothetical protein
MASIDDILGQLKLPERVYPLCMRADLRAEWEAAEAELAAAERSVLDSLAGSSKATAAAAKRVQQLEAEMAEHTVHLKLRALTHRAWSDLLAKHPPRPDTDDTTWNSETFGVALLAACAVDPVMTEDQAGTLVDRLTLGQWNDLVLVLYNINTDRVDVPKSRRASVLLQSSPKK